MDTQSPAADTKPLREWRDKRYKELVGNDWRSKTYGPDMGAEIAYTWPHVTVLYYKPERDKLRWHNGSGLRAEIRKIYNKYKELISPNDFVIGVDRRKTYGITIGFSSEAIAVAARLGVDHPDATNVLYHLGPEQRPEMKPYVPKPKENKGAHHGRKSI
jgi:hypothetical protein